MHRCLIAVCLAIAPLAASATIYKVRMPDGSILFTDSVPAGGKVIEERAAVPTPTVPRSVPAPARPAAPAATAPAAGTPTLTTAAAEIADAERELAEARKRLEAGREPLPGERIGTVSGRSRLAPEYESRIAGLEQAVAAAEERVKRAYEARNALR